MVSEKYSYIISVTSHNEERERVNSITGGLEIGMTIHDFMSRNSLILGLKLENFHLLSIVGKSEIGNENKL